MILYATIENGELSREAKKGSDHFLEIHLTAFNKKIAVLVLETETDADNKPLQYLLKMKDYENPEEWEILKEGHKKEGPIQPVWKGQIYKRCKRTAQN